MTRATGRAQSLYSSDSPVIAVVEELTSTLRLGGIADPRRVATDIIAALLDVSRSWPVVNGEASVTAGIAESARRAASLLCKGCPFAYAVGTVQFRHLTLFVDPRVLIPRPETEVLVGEVIERTSARFGSRTWGTAIDIGTGSGAIALALATEGRFERVVATDASRDAIDVAASNVSHCVDRKHCDVELRHGSLIAPVRDLQATVIVSNPPYVAFSEMESLASSVRDWEPPLALFSGHDGMSATAAIITQASGILASGGLLALEVDERRASLVAELLMRSGEYTDVGVRLDLAGRERFVMASRR